MSAYALMGHDPQALMGSWYNVVSGNWNNIISGPSPEQQHGSHRGSDYGRGQHRGMGGGGAALGGLLRRGLGRLGCRGKRVDW